MGKHMRFWYLILTYATSEASEISYTQNRVIDEDLG